MTLAASILATAASATAPAAADRLAINRQLAAIYAPYTVSAPPPTVWDRPLFTAEISRLIARWKQVMPEDEVDDLNGGDWLCLCQDWDPKKFSAAPQGQRLLAGGVVEVTMAIDLGIGQRRTARLYFRREGAQWKLANMHSSDFPRGLIQSLRETIAADEKLAR